MRYQRTFKPLSQLGEDEVVAQLQGVMFGFLMGVVSSILLTPLF